MDTKRKNSVDIYPILIFVCLILVASVFSMKTNIDIYQRVSERVGQKDTYNYRNYELLGIGAEGWTAVFTGVLAFFTMALAIFTLRLFQITKDGIVEQGNFTRESLRHAAASADVAIQALSSNRAWICFESVHCSPASNIRGAAGEKLGNGLRLQVEVKNFGNTPAIKCCPTNEVACYSMHVEAAKTFVPDPNRFNEGTMVIGPGKAFGLIPRFIHGQDFLDVEIGSKKIFIYARIDYQTIAGLNQNAFTELCLETFRDGFQEVNGKLIPNYSTRISGPQNLST